MRWIMDALQHARYKQPSCGVSLSGFLSEAGAAMKEKTQSTSSHLDYLPSPAPSPETSRKINSGKEPALQSSCHRAQGVPVLGDWGAALAGCTVGVQAGPVLGVWAGQLLSVGAGPALLEHW